MGLIFWCLSFSSIGILLLHLDGWLPMHRGGLWIFAPSLAVMAGLAVQSWRRGDAELLRRIYLGFLGGTLGTLGYDLFRIPFHYAGFNVFAPIYAYGMWICGLEQSTLTSDVCGFFYHLSNGITFGWIYSLGLTRRGWWWAVLWGLALEGLAVASVFGAVFSIRAYSGLLVIAFVAHVFYGLPLGVICERWEKGLSRWNRVLLATAVVVTLLVAAWLVNASLPATARPSNRAASIRFTPQGIAAPWSNWPAGSSALLLNETGADAVVLVRAPSAQPGQPPTPIAIEASGQRAMTFDESGIYQLGLQGSSARSVFVSVHRNGSYVPARRNR